MKEQIFFVQGVASDDLAKQNSSIQFSKAVHKISTHCIKVIIFKIQKYNIVATILYQQYLKFLCIIILFLVRLHKNSYSIYMHLLLIKLSKMPSINPSNFIQDKGKHVI